MMLLKENDIGIKLSSRNACFRCENLKKYKRKQYMALSAAISILLTSFVSSRIYRVSVQ
jgi:hypothetical protein